MTIVCNHCGTAKGLTTVDPIDFHVQNELLGSDLSTPVLSNQMLVVLLPETKKLKFPKVLQAFDRKIGKRLEEKVNTESFDGAFGTRLLVDLNEYGVELDAPRYILFMGLGKPSAISNCVQCAVYGAIAQIAVSLDVCRIQLVLAGARLPDMATAGAILRCRFTKQVQSLDAPSKLQDVILICSQADSLPLNEGLAAARKRQLCTVCSLPLAS